MENFKNTKELQEEENLLLQSMRDSANKGNLDALARITSISDILFSHNPTYKYNWKDYISCLSEEQLSILDNKITSPEEQYKYYEKYKDTYLHVFSYLCLRCSGRGAAKSGYPEAQYRIAKIAKIFNNNVHKYLTNLLTSARMGEEGGYKLAQEELAEYSQSRECSFFVNGVAEVMRKTLLANLKEHNPLLAQKLE